MQKKLSAFMQNMVIIIIIIIITTTTTIGFVWCHVSKPEACSKAHVTEIRTKCLKRAQVHWNRKFERASVPLVALWAWRACHSSWCTMEYCSKVSAHTRRRHGRRISDCESQVQPKATCLSKSAECGRGYAAPAAPPSRQALKPCRGARYVSRSILKTFFCRTGNQCSWWRTRVMCSNVLVLVAMRAAVFCRRWSLLMSTSGKPKRRLLQLSSRDVTKACVSCSATCCASMCRMRSIVRIFM